MMTTRNRFLCSLAATLLLLAQVDARAATVSAEAHPQYRRLSFGFTAPAQMKATHSGMTVTLNFNQVVGVSTADVKAQLGDYVTAVNASSDGKTLILTLKNDAEIRKFVTGKTVGIDIVGDDPSAAKAAANAPAPFKRAQTTLPVSKKAAASTVKAAPIAAVEQAPASANAGVYTTKKTANPLTTTIAPVAVTPATRATAAAAPSLLITTRHTADGTEINFPWNTRTAAAIFERPRAIWIVFSHEADAHVAQLATILPKQVVRVEQYAYPGALVLRLTTDGTLHAIASQSGTNYEWNVTLGATAKSPALDTAVSTDATANNPYVLLNLFDVAPPLQFFDPVLQDRLLVVPAYETSRGLGLTREYPEFTLLPTQQGIAIAAQRNDITAEATRQGIRISAPKALAVSPSLPLLSDDAEPIRGLSTTANVLIPYDQWYVAPRLFWKQRLTRLDNLARASEDAAPAALHQLVALYMGSGFVQEAYAYAQLIKQQYPDYYTQHKLGVVSAACDVYMNRLPEAAVEISAKELDGSDEANMWRQLIAVLMPQTPTTTALIAAAGAPAAATPPTPAPAAANATAPVANADGTTPLLFDFEKYNKQFIRFYPPHLRQRIVLMMADADAMQGHENSVLGMFATLANDGVMPPMIDSEAQIFIARVAAKKNRVPQALEILDKVSADSINRHAQTRARFTAIMLRYSKGMIDAKTAIDGLEHLSLSWRGDRLEHDILTQLAQLYLDTKHYGDTLRTWKALIDGFPNDPGFLKLSGDMSELFERLFLNGEADSMPPLESLATFYEFRELTPVGDHGDAMIQKLADRLASVDLIDRAVQLLQSQIKFRLSGESRARVGARLALLQLINQQPQDALSTIETTNFTGSAAELQLQRAEISAQALSALGRTEEALSIIAADHSHAAALLRLDIYWGAKDWPNVINQAEDLLGARLNLTAPLNPQETDILLKLVLGYTFEGDHTQLKYLRDYYSGLLTDSAYKQIFDYLTNDTTPLDTEDFALVATQISHTESFLDSFRQKIAQGKLSESIK